jgi:hypothetical protein
VAVEALPTVARGCARIASCAHPHDPSRARDPGACVDWWLAHASDVDEPIPPCLRQADTCATVDRCLHQGADPGAVAYCVAHPGVAGGCDAARFVSCGDDDVAESTLTDCAALGGVCAQGKAAGGLVSYGCVAPRLCPKDQDRAWCDGASSVLRCSEGSIERIACRSGTRCRAHVHGDGLEFAMCEAEGHRDCPEPGTRRCVGARLEECAAHGHYAHVRTTDCAALGLTCGGAAGRASCVSPGNACSPGPPACEGEAIAFCAAGRRLTIACGALGLGACDPAARGPEAACRAM